MTYSGKEWGERIEQNTCIYGNSGFFKNGKMYLGPAKASFKQIPIMWQAIQLKKKMA